MYVKKNTRVTFRPNRRHGHKRNSNFSNGKVRNKGNIVQQHQKYLKLAKEAFSSGDRIQSEYYYQFADHYSRLMLELGLVVDGDSENQGFVDTKSQDLKSENDNNTPAEIEDEKNKKITEAEDNNDHGSIESISFISEPIKKKSVKNNKDSA